MGVLQPMHVSFLVVKADRPPTLERTTVFVRVCSPSENHRRLCATARNICTAIPANTSILVSTLGVEVSLHTTERRPSLPSVCLAKLNHCDARTNDKRGSDKLGGGARENLLAQTNAPGGQGGGPLFVVELSVLDIFLPGQGSLGFVRTFFQDRLQ